ncbi:hypothetical protein TWF718_003639 [Orbilia javanica]|uniref:Uncharacterized protein n=1 Tax=Orbilia javanica TaxID=47235 RepID=A0AAN8MRB6_9PEZI
MRPARVNKSLRYIIEAFKHMLVQFDEVRWALRREMRNTCPELVPKLRSGESNRGLPIVILTEEEIDSVRFPDKAGRPGGQVEILEGSQQGSGAQLQDTRPQEQNGGTQLQDVDTERQEMRSDMEDVGRRQGTGGEVPFPQAQRPLYEDWVRKILDEWGCDDMMDIEIISRTISEVVHYAEAARTATLDFFVWFDHFSGFETGVVGHTPSENLRRLARQLEGARINMIPGRPIEEATVTYDSITRRRVLVTFYNLTKRLETFFFAIGQLEGDIELLSSVQEFLRTVSEWELPHVTQDNKIMALFEGMKVWYDCWRKPLLKMLGAVTSALGPPPDPSPARWVAHPAPDGGPLNNGGGGNPV